MSDLGPRGFFVASVLATASLCLLGAAAVACSGKVITLGNPDAATSDDGGLEASTVPTPVPTEQLDGSPPPAPVIDATTTDCTALNAQIAAMRTQAETCCPICNTVQCDIAVPDVCCPFSATGNPPAGFAALVDEYKMECNPVCPASCPRAPSGMCITSNPSNPSAQGVCQ